MRTEINTEPSRRALRNTLNKLFVVVLATIMLIASLGTMTGVYADVTDNSKIVILHTNDVHCSYARDDKNGLLGYEGYAWLAKQYKSQYANVTLVDDGDNIQGAPAGILSKGSYLIGLMNSVGYDISAVGNHEFDYGVDRLLELTTGTAAESKFPYVSCNFIDLKTGKTVYDPYVIEEYATSQGTKKVAFVGVTTPESITKTAADTFTDDKGNKLYSFCEDSTGEALYECVQNAVDEARNTDKADYVVLLAHLGQSGVETRWRSDTLVSKTNGIDAVIDGHSHEVYTQSVANKDGKSIPIAQTGTQLTNIGVLTINVETGDVTDELKNTDIGSDADIKNEADNLTNKLNEKLGEKVATSAVNLYVHELDGYYWACRRSETNIGDLVTDAYRTELNADVSIINGGGLRDDIAAGDVTYGDLLKVQPFGNDTAVIKVTGQQLLDALEMGARKYPDYNAAFMHVSGMTYEINSTIPSGVVTTDEGVFVRVDGQYRVNNVKVNGEALDLTKEYTVAGISFTLLKQGDGLSMFKDCEVLVSCGPKDFEVVSNYVKNELNGVIGTEYEGRFGQGRITIYPYADEEALELIYKKFNEDEDSPYKGQVRRVQIVTDGEPSETDKALIAAKVPGKKLIYNTASLILTLNNNEGTKVDIGNENDIPVKVTYEFDFTDKKDIQVLRAHTDVSGVTTVDELTEKANEAGEYVKFDKDAGTITVCASKYSTYAFAYNDEVKAADTGDANEILPYAVTLIISVIALIAVISVIRSSGSRKRLED